MEKFLKELSELSNKHGIAIAGCGCQGSAFLFDIKSNEIIAERLEFEDSKYVSDQIKK